MVAQGAHASLAAILSQAAIIKFPKAHVCKKIIQAFNAFLVCLKSIFSTTSDTTGFMIIRLTLALEGWLYDGLFTKITVGIDSDEDLVKIYEEAKSKGMICSLITDAGKTEFHGVLTHTVVAVGPAESDEIDKITGKLKLL